MPFVLGRLPTSDEELWWVVKKMWGVTLPRHTCGNPEHTAPFQAFADAYFRRGTTALWHGSRGLSGKSYMLSILGITNAFLLGCDVNMLGGSLAQSANIHMHMRNAFDYVDAPRYMVDQESSLLVTLTNKAKIRPLTASQKTVRGPHPPFLILDEIDEMDIEILDAALGQPMPQVNYLGQTIEPYTALCSTWQNAEGCMSTFTPIYTRRGQIPIQDVVIGDEVMTRDGWREVSNSIDTGMQECVTVTFASGRVITCTPWHPVWTQEGWVRADSLTPFAHVGVDVVPMTTPVGSSPDTLAVDAAALTAGERAPVVRVPVLAGGLGDADGSGSFVVDGWSHRLEMPGVDAVPLSAQMIQMSALGDRPDSLLVDPAVGQDDSLGEGSVALVAVPVLSLAERPGDALVGIQLDGVSAQVDVVVNVAHTGMLLPTWDLTVEDTHEYVAGGILVHNTFTEIKRRFEERNLPIIQWCYKCSANPIDGWLSQKTIDEKKSIIPDNMWRTEYELGEPAIGNRAFDSEAVDDMFSPLNEPIHEVETKDYWEYKFEEPERDGYYVAAADWGKEQDYTVISVWRADVTPFRLVYYMKVNRRPYPQMIGWFNDAIELYGADAIHDATGLGNVVNDYVDVRARGFTMTGEKRDAMLTEYVNAVEKGAVVAPHYVRSAFTAHKYCQVGDLYSRSKEYHLPDEVCSFALAYKVMGRAFGAVGPINMRRSKEPSRLEQQFAHPDRLAGEVVDRTEEERAKQAFSLLV